MPSTEVFALCSSKNDFISEDVARISISRVHSENSFVGIAQCELSLDRHRLLCKLFSALSPVHMVRLRLRIDISSRVHSENSGLS